MKINHAIDGDGLLISGEHLVTVIASGDNVLIPIEEANTSEEKRINCEHCAYALAKMHGGMR